ncbi:hypothetical protein F0U61_40860 [Archangium violaceum]|jgi:hypothetical protein|uniref:hypothetical protein n=1 Tax=Archangium violaceum TaxID=83451 RepID=UPI00193B92B1|nr:hypothetical protein [Archangium violaceum]QRK08530.1 hypothetical protein JQX13_53030 [Archangium violaceum]WNG39314.1 hypothetical protein F0U61_40860 [Archangium violaceum]
MSSEIPFHATRMGYRYYESTLPALVRQLTRLNDNLERLLALAERGKPSEGEQPQPKREGV